MKKKHISAYRGAGLDPNRITKKKRPERVSAYSKAETNRGGLLEGTGYVAGRLGLGIAGVGEGLGDIVSAGGDLLRGDTEMAKYRFLDNQTAEAQQSLTEWYNPGKGMQFAGDVASGVGQSSVFLLDALVPGLGTGLFFTGITGQSVAGAAQQTGDVGWKELGYGVASGAAEAALGKLVGAGGKVAGKLGSSLTRSTGKAIGQRGVTTALTKATGKRLAGMGWNVAKNTLADAAGEFTEEFAAEYIDTGLQRLFGIDPNASTSFGEALRAGAVGFVSGAAMGAPANVYNYNNSVAAGRAIREEGGVDQLLYRAAATVDVLKEQEAQAREKGSTKATLPEDAGLVGKTAAKGKQAVANLGAKITASKTKGYWSKLEKNINAYMNMDEAMRNSDVGDALLGELRGNLFFTNMSYAVEEAEEALQNATDEEITGWLVEVNDKAKKAGKADANYTVEDFRANKDGILSTVAAAFWIDEIRRTANGTTTDETATESPAEPAQAPLNTTAEEVTAQEENDATEATEAEEPDPWESIEGIEGFGTQNAQEEALLRAASSQGVPKRTVPAMLKSYREGTDLTPAEFAEAWGDGVMYFGRLGLNESAIYKDSPLDRVGENARRASIQEGKTIADEELKRAKEKAEKKKMPARNQADAKRKQEGRGAIVKGKGLIVQNLDAAQYTAYKAAEMLAPVLGTDIVIETDLKTDTGKQINGFYSKKTNGIHININAKRNGQSIALYTLGHEVTHYIKEWSPAKFEALADFVMDQMGVDAETAIADKLASLKRLGVIKDTMTMAEANALAREELVAEGMELVLTDGKVLEELAHTDRSLWQKVKAWIQNIISKIRKYYGELNQASKTAQVLKETVESLEEIERLFTEGVTEAGERTRTAEAGVIVDDASGTAMLSVDDIPKTERRTTDTAYLAAVERGDMETAQKMVDEAAKAAGYTEEMFHGMGGRYNVYKSGNGQYGSGVYFTADKDIAADYGKVVDHLYVKVGKIADYEDAYRVLGKTDDQTLDDFAQTLGFPNFDEMVNDWDNDPTDVASNSELIEMLKNRGFEGFIDDGNAGFVLWDFDGIAYRIKSADPVTYDDNGNVIHLSERFKEDNPDIRYSIDEDTDTAYLAAEDKSLLFDADFYERYENESREPITETVQELEEIKASEAFDTMSDDEVFDLNAKLKAKRAGYNTVYDYYVETEKERMTEEYRRYVQTGRSNRTSRTLEEKRKKAQKERTLRSDEASATPLQNAQYKIIQETNPMWDEYHTGIRSPKEIKTFAEVAEDPDSFTWGDFTREDARKALRDGTVRVYSSYAIKNGVFVSTSYQQALEYAGNDPARVHSRVVALDSVAWINGDEGQYAKVYKDDGIRYSIDEDTDTAYLAAVERGDMETAQRMVKEKANQVMSESKIRDEDGRILEVYHGTNGGNFTVFDWDFTQRADGGFFGRGHYFTPRKGMAKMYGKRVVSVFLDIKNPFNFNEELLTIDGHKTSDFWAHSIYFMINSSEKLPEWAGNKTVLMFDGERDEEGNEIPSEIPWREIRKKLDLVANNAKPVETRNEFGESVFKYMTFDERGWPDMVSQREYKTENEALAAKYEAIISMMKGKFVGANTVEAYVSDEGTEFTEALKRRKYDGVRQNAIYHGDEIVAFYSSQIKSADPVTYDDNGNVIPLSERFKADDPDIRYSIDDTPETPDVSDSAATDRDSEGNQLSKAQQEFFRDSKVRDENGNLMVVYHGTESFGFTTFDADKLDDKRSIFFTDSVETASTYSAHRRVRNVGETTKLVDGETRRGIYKCYVNIANPLVVKCNGSNWNNIRIKANDVHRNWESPYYGLDQFITNYSYGDYFLSTRDLAKFAYEKGYDGVIFEDIVDNGGKNPTYKTNTLFDSSTKNKGQRLDAANVYVAFDSAQAKATTNKTPTSDPDIRYSIDDTPETPDVSDSAFDEALRRAGLSHLVEETAETEDTETAPSPRKAPRERDPEEDRLERIRAHETLANALMEAAQNEHEFKLVKNYQQKAAELADAEVRKEDLRKKTAEVNREIDALQSKLKGIDKTKREPWVMTALTDAQKRKGELIDEMNALDEKLRTETDKLLSLASAKQLRKLIRTERSKAAAMERSAERARQREMDRKEWAKETVKKAREESEEKVKKARREATDYKQAVYRTAYAKADEKNQKYRDRLDEMAKQSMERREITIRMREARRVLGYLNTMLYHPTKQKHVPESLQALVDKALRSADPKQFGINRDHIREMSELAGKIRKLESKAGRTTAEQETLDKMKTKYEKLEADTISVKRQAEALMTAFEQYVTSTTDDEQIDKNMLEGLRQTVTEIEEAPLNEMTLESLKAVEKIYTVIYHQVNTANQAFATSKAANIDEMSTEANTQVKNAKELKVLSPRSREWAALAGVRSFLWKNMKPLTVFEAIGSDKLMEIFRRVLDAEDVWITDILEAKKVLDDAKKEHGYNKWNLKERREVTTADGSKVSLTLGEMMSLYAYMFREQAEQHLSAGGFVFAPNAEAIESFKGDKGKYRAHLNDQTTHRMRKEDIAKMSEMLTEEQRAYAKAVQEYLTSLGAKGNEVSHKLYGIDLFKETAYFPIKSSDDYIETQTGKSGDPNIKSRGTFKETVPKAGNPIVLEDFMEVVGNHVNTMATYHAFVLPVEDLNRVWNYTPVNIKRDADGKAILDDNGMPVADKEGAAGYNSLKAEIAKKYGKEANDYILQLLRDLNGGARRESAASILDKGLTAFKRSATMLSLSTIVQQPTSIIRAMAYVDAKHFTGASFVPWGTVKKYAPVAAIKEMGGFDTGTGARTAEYINAKQYDSIKDAAKAAVTPEIYGGDPNVRAEAFGWLTGKADEVSWRYLFGAIVNEQAEKLGKAKDSEAVLKAAGERFAEVVRHTQVYDSTLTRSEFMRSKDGLMKMATAFGAEPTTILSMAAEAIVKLERGDKAFFRKTAGAVAASILVNAVISSIIYAMRDDDEEKNILEKYTESVTSEIIEGFNPLEYLPIARDVMSIFKGYDIERTDMSLISNLYQQIELLTSSKRSPADKIAGVSGAVGAFFGLPITNVYRDAKGIVLTTAGILDPEPVTGRGMGNAVGQGIKGQTGLLGKIFGKEMGDSYELYKAYVKGDKAHYDRVAARYETEADLEYALRRELRENDKRIVEAAEAKHSGDLAVYESIVDQIESEGIFDRNIVIRAINNEVSELKRAAEKDNLVPKDETATDEEETAESLYTASDLNAALERGDTEDFAAIMSALVENKVSTGKTEAQAKASVKSSITAYWKKQYLNGYQDTETRKRIIAILTETGLYGSRNDVATMCEGWVKASK